MYPYFPAALVANRSAALEGVQAITDILLLAGQRYAELIMESGRRTLELGGSLPSEPHAAPAHWLQQTGSESTRVLEAAYAIACDTHTALIAAGEAQVKRFDQVVRSALQRAADWSPWESAIAFNALRTTLDSAENAIHEMTEVATQTIEVAEKEARLIASAVVPAAPKGRSRKA